MSRRVRVAVFVVVALLLVGGVTVVLVGRSRLENWNAEIDRRWMPLRSSLVIRYQKLAALNEAFLAENGDDRVFNRRIERGLGRWERLRGRSDVDEEGEAATAGALERSARRLITYTVRSTALRPSPALNDTIVAFARSPLPLPELPRYNRSIVDYEETRDSVIGAPAAHLLAYYGRSRLGLTIV